MRRAIVCLALAFSFSGGVASGQSVGLSKLETNDLRLLYYDPLQTYLTPYVAQAYENSFAFQRRLFDWTPSDKPTVLLRDLSDNGRAIMRGVPFNELTIDVAPISSIFETFSPGERFFILMDHELVHVATMDVANDQDAWWRGFLHGKPLPIIEHPESILYNYLAAPRTNVPRWYLEGSAVFMETWMGGGLGRAQGGYDEMVFRAMVRDNAPFYDPLGLEAEGNSIDFQVGANDYLYGTRFYSYLALTYSPEKVIEWLKRGPDSDRYYSTQFERVFGKPLDDAWQDWIRWEHDFQKVNLALVAQYPLTPVQKYTATGLGSVSRAYYEPKTQSLIGGFRYPGVIAHMGVLSLENGSIRHLADIKGPALYRVASVAYDPAAGKAYFTADNNAFRDLMEVDVATGKTRMLIEDARIGDIVLDPVDRSIWGIRNVNGLDSLVRVGPDHGTWEQLATFPYGHVLFDLDISRDGALLLASVGEINGDQSIEVYRIADVLKGEVKAIAAMKLGTASPEGGAFSPDGRYVYATAYYTGISNVYRLEIANGDVQAVSNASTGFFRPIPLDDGSLIVFEYTGQGFIPAKIDPKPLNDLGTVIFLGAEIARTHPIVKSWAVGSPTKIPIDSMITARGEYIPNDELRLDSAYPIVTGYKAHAALGWYVQFEDPLLYNELTASVSYSPANDLDPGEPFHADVAYHTLYWHIAYKHNGANFYDLFGPTERSRKGDAILAGYKNVMIYDPPRELDFTADLNLYSGLDALPGAQNVQSSASGLAESKIGLAYTNVDQSLGAVDYEAGYRAGVAVLGDYARDEFFPKIEAGFDFGFALPWAHTSAWLYTAVGTGTGDTGSPLRDFYFGAFGNNFVDDGEVKRYREYESFPGFKIDALGARSFLKGLAEWNAPPVRFNDVGTPGLYLSSARTAVFAGVLNINPGGADERTVETIGAQIDFNFSVAVRLPMTFSLGYAKGLGEGPGRHDEIMASVKIL